VYGIAFSGAFTMIQVVVAELYSGSSYGKILGIFTMIDTLAGSMGIIVLGSMRKNSGSYLGAFDTMILLCGFACICVLALQFMKKPQL
jgi:nitrate/nitrite transporter NarK